MTAAIRVLGASDVAAALDGAEARLVGLVRAAYEAHDRGASALPHSTFLRFPAAPANRIIALPAYLAEPAPVCGMKWIASFPGNHAADLDRASALITLNSPQTGRPVAVLEGSLISAARTAASAALAASVLHQVAEPQLGFIGCGPINRTIARFLRATLPRPRRALVCDTLPAAAARFEAFLGQCWEGLEVVQADAAQLLAAADLVSLATTAASPHIASLGAANPDQTLLHISLRDLSPAVILACDNVVDDVDHVCREQTALHLTEQRAGNRDFIRCTLGAITRGQAPARPPQRRPVVFSPFGLGVLDLAVAAFVLEQATAAGRGTVIDAFLPG